MAWKEEGNRSAAHRESNEREGEAGDALWAANRTTAAVGAEDEDGVEDGVAGNGRSHGWSRSTPGNVLSTVARSVAALGDGGHGGDMAGRR